MPVNVSGTSLGDPIVITSGAFPCNLGYQNLKVDKIYWLQPTLAVTSSVLIVSGNQVTESSQILLQATCEQSGQSQMLDIGRRWWTKPYLACMPTGTLFIYLKGGMSD